MNSNICSICNQEFHDDYFEKEQNKCYLHCEKESWHQEQETILGKLKVCDDFRYKKFGELFIPKIVQNTKKSLRLQNIHFPYNPIINENYLGLVTMKQDLEEIYMSECTFYGDQNIELNQHDSFELKRMNLFRIKSNYKVSFSGSKIQDLKISTSDIYNLHIQFSTFSNITISGNFSSNDYHTINNINIIRTNVLNESWIYELDLNRLRLHNVNFSKITMERLNISENVELDKSKFEHRFDFFDVIYLGSLNLDKTLLPKACSFLGLTSQKENNTPIKIENRETARIIKDSFEQQNNIIEANKFYALEMNEREKELDKDVKKGKNIFEWLVFKIHGLVSNHSQDWTLSLLWIILISCIVTVFNQTYFYETDRYLFISLITTIPIGFAVFTKELIQKISLLIFTFIFIQFNAINWDFLANQLNPFSIMTGKEHLTFSGLIYKVIIAYLIYQLIISIRQNTRRK